MKKLDDFEAIVLLQNVLHKSQSTEPTVHPLILIIMQQKFLFNDKNKRINREEEITSRNLILL